MGILTGDEMSDEMSDQSNDYSQRERDLAHEIVDHINPAYGNLAFQDINDNFEMSYTKDEIQGSMRYLEELVRLNS